MELPIDKKKVTKFLRLFSELNPFETQLAFENIEITSLILINLCLSQAMNNQMAHIEQAEKH